jgi:hypothetical protein
MHELPSLMTASSFVLSLENSTPTPSHQRTPRHTPTLGFDGRYPQPLAPLAPSSWTVAALADAAMARCGEENKGSEVASAQRPLPASSSLPADPSEDEAEDSYTFKTVSAVPPPREQVLPPLALVTEAASRLPSLSAKLPSFSTDLNTVPCVPSVSPSPMNHVFQPPPQPGVSAPKKKDSHARPREAGHVPRPRNPFILFRMDVVSRNLISGEKRHQNISKIVSEMWHNVSSLQSSVASHPSPRRALVFLLRMRCPHDNC